MATQECRMVKVSVFEAGDKCPIAVAITIAPSYREAKECGEEELKPYIPNQSGLLHGAKELGLILWSPSPTTIFLYTQHAGRIK